MNKDLLAEHPDGRYNARVNWDPMPIPGREGEMVGFNVPNPFSTYAEGYKRAADVLVETAAETTYDSNVLVYPVLFCYRHYVELRLKEIVIMAGELLDRNEALPMKHDLPKLWAIVRPLLEEVFDAPRAKSDLDDVEDLVAQLGGVDPRSYAFRYPVDTSMNPSLPGLIYVNVKQFSEVINRVAPTLDGASFAIEEFLDTKREVQSEAYQDAMEYAEPPDYSDRG